MLVLSLCQSNLSCLYSSHSTKTFLCFLHLFSYPSLCLLALFVLSFILLLLDFLIRLRQVFLILTFLLVFEALYSFQSNSTTPMTWRFRLENGLLLSPAAKVLLLLYRYACMHVYLCGLLIIMAGVLLILFYYKKLCYRSVIC